LEIGRGRICAQFDEEISYRRASEASAEETAEEGEWCDSDESKRHPADRLGTSALGGQEAAERERYEREQEGAEHQVA